jgi:hypothetical protein
MPRLVILVALYLSSCAKPLPEWMSYCGTERAACEQYRNMGETQKNMRDNTAELRYDPVATTR